jgi:hypothetical protein
VRATVHIVEELGSSRQTAKDVEGREGLVPKGRINIVDEDVLIGSILGRHDGSPPRERLAESMPKIGRSDCNLSRV